MGTSTTQRAPRNLNLPLMIALSVIMVIFGLAAYSPLPQLADAPIFTSFREPDTGELFLNSRLKSAPVLYGLMHAIPAIIWSIGMPIQHSVSIRARRPALHRWCGRISFIAGIFLNVTGLILIAKKLSYSIGVWELEKFGPLRFPSFSASTAFLGIIWPPSLIQAYRTARAKQWAAHRRYATIYTLTGYGVLLERASLISVQVVGTIIGFFPKLSRSLGVPDIGKAGFESERTAFAFANVMAYGLAIGWWFWLTREPSVKAKKVV